jgi:hypothetical protein
MATVRTLRDGSIIIKDGSGTPKTLTIPISDGDLSFERMRNAFLIMNRGVIDSRRAGDQTAMSLDFSIKFEQWNYSSGASTGLSVQDVLAGDTPAVTAGWVSTDTCGPYAVTIEFRIADPCNVGHYEALTFTKFMAEKFSFKEGSEANTLSISGTALMDKPTRTYV